MALSQWLASLFAPSRAHQEPEAASEPDEVPESAPGPEPDVGEEFQKVHRGLRRLSLASDRSGEILQAVSARLDEMQQRLLTLGRPAKVGVTLEESELLRVLDQLDRAGSFTELPAPARELVAAAKSELLRAAGWQPIAVAGAKPQGVDIRIAEFVGEGAAGGHQDARIDRVLEQGYRRADGSLLRPGVVIAAASLSHNQGTVS
jgi:molecular chaperone GrpE (heat shock protein)